MKKLGLLVLGIVAGIIAVANLGSLLALALSAAIAYAGFHYYRKSESTVLKLFWGIVLLIGLFSAVANVPAFIGIIALLGVTMHGINGKAQKTTTSSQMSPTIHS